MEDKMEEEKENEDRSESGSNTVIEMVEEECPTVEDTLASDKEISSEYDSDVIDPDTDLSGISYLDINPSTDAELADGSDSECANSQDWDEDKVDNLLRIYRVRSEIKSARKRGAMVMEGPFYIDIKSTPVHLYQEALVQQLWNPAKVAFDICYLCRWTLPEYHALEYNPTEGFLYSVTVNDHAFLCKHPGKTPDSGKDMAAARFLQFLGFRISYPEMKLSSEWTHLEDPSGLEMLDKQEVDLTMRINHATNFALWRSRYYYRNERRVKNITSELERMKSLLDMDHIYETLCTRASTCSLPDGPPQKSQKKTSRRRKRESRDCPMKLASIIVKRPKTETESGSSRDSDLRDLIDAKAKLKETNSE